MSTARILALGGGGFVGRHVVARLVAAGCNVVVPTRYRERAKHLILLPTVDVVEADIHDPPALEQLAAGAAAAINLVGILNETRRGDFERVHVELPRKLGCRVPRDARAAAFAHERAERGRQGSEPLPAQQGRRRSACRRFRPCLDDLPALGDLRSGGFVPQLVCAPRALLPVIALARADARFQPVYVGDVADAFVRAVDDDRTHRMRYPLCGPKVYTLRELVAYVGELTGYNRPIVPLGPRCRSFRRACSSCCPES